MKHNKTSARTLTSIPSTCSRFAQNEGEQPEDDGNAQGNYQNEEEISGFRNNTEMTLLDDFVSGNQLRTRNEDVKEDMEDYLHVPVTEEHFQDSSSRPPTPKFIVEKKTMTIKSGRQLRPIRQLTSSRFSPMMVNFSNSEDDMGRMRAMASDSHRAKQRIKKQVTMKPMRKVSFEDPENI